MAQLFFCENMWKNVYSTKSKKLKGIYSVPLVGFKELIENFKVDPARI